MSPGSSFMCLLGSAVKVQNSLVPLPSISSFYSTLADLWLSHLGLMERNITVLEKKLKRAWQV